MVGFARQFVYQFIILYHTIVSWKTCGCICKVVWNNCTAKHPTSRWGRSVGKHPRNWIWQYFKIWKYSILQYWNWIMGMHPWPVLHMAPTNKLRLLHPWTLIVVPSPVKAIDWIVDFHLSWVLMSFGRQHLDGSRMINLGKIRNFSP